MEGLCNLAQLHIAIPVVLNHIELKAPLHNLCELSAWYPIKKINWYITVFTSLQRVQTVGIRDQPDRDKPELVLIYLSPHTSRHPSKDLAAPQGATASGWESLLYSLQTWPCNAEVTRSFTRKHARLRQFWALFMPLSVDSVTLHKKFHQLSNNVCIFSAPDTNLHKRTNKSQSLPCSAKHLNIG